MDTTAIDTLSVSETAAKRLTWRRSAWIVIALLALGMGLGVLWPLWLMPPRLTDTVSVYLALSQLWLVAFVICLLLRPSEPGRRSMLNAVAVAWPFTALLAFNYTGGVLLTPFTATLGLTIDLPLFLLLWILYMLVPFIAFKKWFGPADEKLLALRRPFLYMLLGIAVTVIYGFFIVGNVALANGGPFTTALKCDAPTVASSNVTYVCYIVTESGQGVEYDLNSAGGSPVGQMHRVDR